MNNSTRPPIKNSHRGSTGGRPRLPNEHLRANRIVIRLSDVEVAQLRASAANVSLPLATYIRTEALKCRLHPLPIPKANLIYVDEINRLGNNLNQLLVLIYTNRAPLGLLSTLKDLRRVVESVKAMMLGVGEPCDS